MTGGRRARRPGTALLRHAPALTLAVLVGPVAAGLAGTLLPALGWLPALGGIEPGLDAWRALFAWPGLAASLKLSITTGLAAAFISTATALLIVAAWQGTRTFALVERALSPLLSVPHAAAAFALAFLIAPSGWIARALSPWATGWDQPPDWLIVNDPAGLALVAGLVVKEVPFLVLMILAALTQADSARALIVARTLGYGRVTAWAKAVLPRVYPQIRLPVFAVLAYSVSTVDVAMILGPASPPPLGVQIVRWTNDPDLSLRFRAAAGAILLTLCVLALILLWRLGERLAAGLGRRWVEAGGRGRGESLMRGTAIAAAGLIAGTVAAGLAGLAVWSCAGLWIFPGVLPANWSAAAWQRAAGSLGEAAGATVMIGLAATALALCLVLACLESESRHGLRPTTRSLWLLYLPLIVPQVAFLTGLQTLALAAGIDSGPIAVTAAHLVFVLPYVFLSLADPWRSWDARAGLVAATLGSGPSRIFWRVRLPMLLRPVLVATAVGLAVSAGLYLPTLLVGGGRVSTLTTEAVALASGGDRRLIGVYALAQTALPFVGFAAALAVPALVYRNRRGLRP